MKIKVKDLLPNPYRDFDLCPIDRVRVDRLKQSYIESSFWGGLVGRCCPDDNSKVELNVGAHRLVALQESDIEEINIDVYDLSDDDMIRDMLVENLEWHGNTTSEVIETVKASSERITKHIESKNNIYDNLDPWCKELFISEHSFNQTMKDCGQITTVFLGRRVIYRYLKDKLAEETIKFALKVINGESTVNVIQYDFPVEEQEIVPEEEYIPPKPVENIIQVKVPISKEASELFPVIGQARAFVETITRDINCRSAFPTEEDQLRVAKEIVKDNIKLSASIIIDFLKERSREIVEKSEFVYHENDNPLIKAMNSSRSKKATIEIKRVYKRLIELPDYTKQRVFTGDMAQAYVNDLYAMEYFIHNKRMEIFHDLKIEPDKQCIYYENYPSIIDYDPNDYIDLNKPDTEIEEIDYDTELDDDEEEFINGWLKGRNRSDEEID